MRKTIITGLMGGIVHAVSCSSYLHLNKAPISAKKNKPPTKRPKAKQQKLSRKKNRWTIKNTH